jgi:ubiquinone/menaquinone biosynthesis C-methylase UbiE
MPIMPLIRRLPKLDSKKIGKGFSLSELSHHWMLTKTEQTREKINRYLQGKILDIGLGAGTVAFSLKRDGHDVTSVDVVDLSLYSDIKPLLYDGDKLPFKKKSFDTGLLIGVLHHCGDQNIHVLEEAMRVCKRVICIEDTYRNDIERAFVSAQDQICNAEFYEHNYLTVPQWRAVFKKRGWKVKALTEYSEVSFGIFYSRYCMFVLES